MDIIGLIKKHLNMRLASFQTTEVVIVESVDYTTWKCSVRPKPKIDVRGDVQDMPIILEVPIAVQKAGNSVILMPVKVGDIGICTFSKHAIDNLLIDFNTVEITIPRTFDLNDAIYIGGTFVEAEDIPSISSDEMLLYHRSGAYIKFDSSGNITIKGKTINMVEL